MRFAATEIRRRSGVEHDAPLAAFEPLSPCYVSRTAMQKLQILNFEIASL